MGTLISKLKESGCDTEIAINHIKTLVKESLDDEGYLLPYWLKYPEIPIDSIGWRMGEGEDYLFLNRLYFQCLSDEGKSYYEQKYRKPCPKERKNHE